MFYFKQIIAELICSKCNRVIPANAHHLVSKNMKLGIWQYCYLCAINKGFPNVEFKRFDYDSRRKNMSIFWSTYNELQPSINNISRFEVLP